MYTETEYTGEGVLYLCAQWESDKARTREAVSSVCSCSKKQFLKRREMVVKFVLRMWKTFLRNVTCFSDSTLQTGLRFGSLTRCRRWRESWALIWPAAAYASLWWGMLLQPVRCNQNRRSSLWWYQLTYDVLDPSILCLWGRDTYTTRPKQQSSYTQLYKHRLVIWSWFSVVKSWLLVFKGLDKPPKLPMFQFDT